MTAPARIDRDQAFRYMGLRGKPEDLLVRRADACEARLLAAAEPRYVWRVCALSPTPEGILCQGTGLVLTGRDIAAHLKGCRRAVLFCATLSAGADGAIRAAGARDLLDQTVTDALASALIEQVCDGAEREILRSFPGEYPTWRFSPGYGDLPLESQGAFLQALNAGKRLGVTLSEGGMCIPSKTVTAVIGLSPRPVAKGKRGCSVCTMGDACPYRKKGAHCK